MTHFSYVGRTLGLTSLTIGAAAGLVSMGALAAFRRSLPRIDGTLRLSGLRQGVSVLRDRWGVPHIYAEHNHDLFMALGYVHAQDRLWQMELHRCTAYGQLAEIFGVEALESDRFARVLGFGRLSQRDAERLDEETRLIFEAYVQGINAFLDSHHNRLPLEFVILRHHPRPWQVADLLAYSRLIAYSLSLNWEYELLNAHMVKMLGAERARALMLHYPADQPITVPENVFQRHGIGEEWLHTPAPSPNGSGKPNGARHSPHGQGSNAWVVRGQRSTSGKPLLASDPHLKASMPAIWYEAHLEGGDYMVTGATLPGMPGVSIGHNQHIAWGVTSAMTDVQDLYIERFHAGDPLRYEWRGGWQQAELVREEIHVKGQAEPVIEEVRITRHGPVITPVVAPAGSAFAADQQQAKHEEEAETIEPAEPYSAAEPDAPREALALRWTGSDSCTTIKAALALNRARNWSEFRAALVDWDTPPQNFIYADTAGHYGYVLSGRLPIRARGEGRLPVPGWSGEYEWTGYLSGSMLPAAYDPPDGLVINSNNPIAGKGYTYQHVIQGEWMNGYRALRIRELLDATPKHDVQSFAQIQNDLHSLPGLHLARLMADVPLSEPLELQAQTLLAEWDGMLDAVSVGGTIYAVLRHHLQRLAYADIHDLQDEQTSLGLFVEAPGSKILALRSLPGILARIEAAQGEDRADPWLGQERTWNGVLQECMRLTVADLSRHYGSDPKAWKYGRMHTLSLHHPLGKVGVLAPVFNRGHWPTGGDVDTVCMGYLSHNYHEPTYLGPIYRQICDTGNWENSISVIMGGQSGHPASRHYSDMAALWLRGEYHPMLWSREQVEAHTLATLILEPEPAPEPEPAE
jgi:penicillin amidase